MSLLESLTIGAGALTAQSFGSKVTANNIANVNTPGYSKQTALLTPNPVPVLGVTATGVQRNVDNILGARLAQQNGVLADANARQSFTSRVETALDPNSDGGLSTKLDDFFSSMRALEAAPSDPTLRQTALNSASDLASDVQSTSASLKDLQQDADTSVVNTVTQANSLFQQVASLNAQIGQASGNTAATATLTDQRDQALQQLSGLVGATYTIDSRGMANVNVAGFGVVMGDSSRQLGTQVDVATGLHHVTIDAPSPVVLDSKLGSSTAAGYINVRDTQIQGRIDELNQFAKDFTSSVNSVHAAGYGLDGTTGNNLFTLGANGDASTFAIDPNMTAQKLATATASGAPGDSSNVSALVGLEDAKDANGGTDTFQQALSASITSAGLATQQAKSDATTEQAKYDQINEAVQNASGVSLDEEDISLESYQRAYQAAAKVVSTVDDMLQTLIDMKQ